MSYAASSLSSRFKKIKTADIIFLSCLAGAVLYMIWLSPFGIASADEAFYLTIPYRLTQGDVFFVDEWHPSQLSGFLLYPLMKLYLLFVPEKAGMILTFRYFYIAAAAVTSIYIYFRGRRISVCGAMAAALFILLYCPFCLKALSYNSMVVLLLSAACITVATAEKHRILDMFFTGLCMAAAVLCNPYLAVVVVLYVFAASVTALYRASHSGCAAPDFSLSGKGIVAFCGGVFTLFAAFCVFIFSRATLRELLDFFPLIFSDPEHIYFDWLWYVKDYVLGIVNCSEYSQVIMILYCVVTTVMLLDKKRMGRRVLYILSALALSVWYFLSLIPQVNANFIMFPINLLGFYAFFLSEKKNKRLFYSVFAAGLFFSFALHHGSNQRFYATCNATAVCAVASAFFILETAKELWRQRKSLHSPVSTITALLMSAALLSQIGVELYVRSALVFTEPSIAYLDTVVPHGIQKGLISTSDKVEDYEAVLADTQEIREADTGYVLYISQHTWLPLADEKLSANCSGWTYYQEPDLSIPWLLNYLNLHPEKYPSYVYVTTEMTYGYKPSYDGKLMVDALNGDGREVEKTATGYIIK